MADYSLLTALNLVFDPDGPALICTTCQYAFVANKICPCANVNSPLALNTLPLLPNYKESRYYCT
jgi:hypothetical protein